MERTGTNGGAGGSHAPPRSPRDASGGVRDIGFAARAAGESVDERLRAVARAEDDDVLGRALLDRLELLEELAADEARADDAQRHALVRRRRHDGGGRAADAIFPAQELEL